MSDSPFRWPLATSPWTLADKAAITKWLWTSDRFTMGEKVAELEARFSRFSGMHALMVANGSVANQLVFELWKFKNPGVTPVVIVPAVTWISSISPAMMAGMEIAFCDVNITDLSFDYDMCERLVENHQAKGRRVILWPTALIGFAPDMARLKRMARRHGADLYLDSCENTFSEIPVPNCYRTDTGQFVELTQSILASADMTTTSCYMSHQVIALEGGFVFFRSKEDYDLGRLFRNHGLVRSLEPDHPLRQKIQRENPKVDPQFLFALAGTNLRPTDVHAMFGLRDFARIEENRDHRNAVYRAFHEGLDHSLYYLPPLSDTHVGFCLPIMTRGDNLPEVKALLAAQGVECRPLIGACLPGYQPPFRQYGPPEQFRNAYWIHHHATYVGLHSGVTVKMVQQLCEMLNGLDQCKSLLTHRPSAR